MSEDPVARQLGEQAVSIATAAQTSSEGSSDTAATQAATATTAAATATTQADAAIAAASTATAQASIASIAAGSATTSAGTATTQAMAASTAATTATTAAATASGAATTATSMSSASAISAAIQNTLSVVPVALPYEVTGISGGVGTGSGGTAGTYAGGVSGGPAGFQWTMTIASGGDIASYQIVDRGISSSSAAPTLSLPSGTGLTGATVPTATVGVIPVNRVFYAPSPDGTQLQAWGNNAGALATAPFGGAQLSILSASGMGLSLVNNIGGYAMAFIDSLHRVAAGITNAGVLFASKLQAVTATITNLTAINLTVTGADGEGVSTKTVGAFQSHVADRVDNLGRIADATLSDGSRIIPKLVIPWQGKNQKLASVLAGLGPSSAKAALLGNLSAGGWPGVMAVPPAMTLSAANALSGIGGSTLDPWNSANGRDLYGTTAQFGANPYKIWTSAFYGGTQYQANGAAREFVHTGTKFEIKLRGSGAAFRIFVSGQLANAAPVTLANDGEAYLYLVDFTAISSSPVKRTIRIEATGALEFGGVYIAPDETIAAPTSLKPPIVGMIGDSFIESGTGTLYPCGGMSFALARKLGWDMHSSGVGSTGLINPGALNTAGAQKVNFQSRVTDLTEIPGLALGMLMLSINDNINSGAWSAGAMPTMATMQAASYAAMANFITEFQSGAPGVPLIVIGPTWPHGNDAGGATQSMYLYRDGCQQACGEFAGVHYVEQYLDTLISGSGNIGALTGAGNADFYVNSDNTHPSQAGHEYRGHVLAAKLLRCVQEEF